MSRLLCQLSYTAMTDYGPPGDARSRRHGRAADQSPNTESNRRPSPYHGDALPTELLGRAMKTLHARPPFTQIRFAAPVPACSTDAQGPCLGPFPGSPTSHGSLSDTTDHTGTTIAL